MTGTAPPGRLPSLTTLRFLFASAVVWYHVSYVSGIFDGALQERLLIGEPLAAGAVSGFFVLSGFVLTWTHTPGGSVRAFWRRRWWRIVPGHLLAWTATVLFFAVTTATVPLEVPPPHGAGAAVASLFLVQSWVPDADVYTAFNAPAWSVSCEVFFYALFPALVVAVRRIPVDRLRRTWAALAVVIAGLPLVATLVPGPVLYDWLPINEYSLWFIYVFPPVRLPEFALGIVTARLLQTSAWPPVGRLPVLACLGVFLAALPLLPPQYVLASAAAPALAAVIAKTALADIEGRSVRLRRPGPVALGEASYALYLLHWPLLMTVRHILGPDHGLPPWAGLALVLAVIALSVGLSLPVHRCVERPLIRRCARRRPEAATARDTPTAPGTPRNPEVV
ncbi:acyltransferase family protein [Streptomyces yaizuensis]|uniref:Acyltransferase n=1 Tax=Streptomyces yaizuensis TaxID=2989713 RepID=A0ABQ5P8A5_9ACTN|nr:acyltransferase [Streptomyces sp. YSPA8]GLF98822.1 acyltransferase [Streptomyces sp. YSPA8]